MCVCVSLHVLVAVLTGMIWQTHQTVNHNCLFVPTSDGAQSLYVLMNMFGPQTFPAQSRLAWCAQVTTCTRPTSLEYYPGIHPLTLLVMSWPVRSAHFQGTIFSLSVRQRTAWRTKRLNRWLKVRQDVALMASTSVKQILNQCWNWVWNWLCTLHAEFIDS